MRGTFERAILYDHFAKPPQFKIGGNEKAKSSCGFFSTLVLIGCVLFIFIQALITMFRRKDPTVNITESVVDDPPEVSLYSLTMAFGLKSLNSQIQIQANWHYRASAVLGIYQSIPDDGVEGYTETLVELQIEPCTKEYFGEMAEEFLEILEDPSSLFCLPRDQPNFAINGKPGAYEFRIISVGFFECGDVNEGCAPESEREEVLSLVQYSFYYADSFTDTTDYKNPIKKTRRMDMEYSNRGEYRYRETRLFPVKIISDKGLIFEENDEKHDLFIGEQETYRSKTEIAYAPGLFFDQTIMLSDRVKTYKRTYKKFQDVFAETTGMTSIIVLVLAIVISPLLEIKFKENLIKRVYERMGKTYSLHFTCLDWLKSIISMKSAKMKLKALETQAEEFEKRLDISSVISSQLEIESFKEQIKQNDENLRRRIEQLESSIGVGAKLEYNTPRDELKELIDPSHDISISILQDMSAQKVKKLPIIKLSKHN